VHTVAWWIDQVKNRGRRALSSKGKQDVLFFFCADTTTVGFSDQTAKCADGDPPNWRGIRQILE